MNTSVSPVFLNYDLYKRNIVNSPLCSCGMREDAYNSFLFVRNIQTFDRLVSLNDLVIIDTHLLWGDNVLSTELNNSIYLCPEAVSYTHLTLPTICSV